MMLFQRYCRVLYSALFAACLPFASHAEDTTPAATPTFAKDVAPFLKAYCTDCHGGKTPEAKLALDRYRDSANIQQDINVWEKVLRFVAARQMPPAEEKQPAPEELVAAQRAIQAEIE